jgi:glucose 1-dehydrogenase
LRGKNVLITGGASGIGQAIAVRFAGYGANIALNYLCTLADAKETEEKVHACLACVRPDRLSRRARRADVSKEEDVVARFDSAVQQLGGLDVLVNNAGIHISRPSHELSASAFDKVVAVKLRGLFLCNRRRWRMPEGGRRSTTDDGIPASVVEHWLTMGPGRPILPETTT